MTPSPRQPLTSRPATRALLAAAVCLLLADGAGAATQPPANPLAAAVARALLQAWAAQPAPAAPAAQPQTQSQPKPKPKLLDEGFIDQGVLEGTDMLEGGLEIGGLTTDQMVTKFGHDLFDTFIHHWRPPEGVSYNLLFSELADPLRGSVATVRLNDQVIFEGPLSPRAEAIADLGKGLARDIRNLLRTNAQLEEEEYF